MGLRLANVPDLFSDGDDIARPGAPSLGHYQYIVDTDTQTPHLNALRFIHAYAKDTRLSRRTVQTRCEQLLDWLRFKAQSPGSNRSEKLVSDYRDALEQAISPRTGRPLASSTINGRIDLAAEFERWIRKADYSKSPFKGGPVERPRRRTTSPTKVVPFSEDEMRRLLEELKPRLAGSRSGLSAKDWLIAFIGFTTGSRIDEILSIDYAQVMRWSSDTKSTTITPNRSKGRRNNATGRVIFVPAHLKNALLNYALGERKHIVAQCKTAFKDYREPKELFLNGMGCPPRHLGLPYRSRRAVERFARAQLQCGITKKSYRYELNTARSREVVLPKHTFHHTRHTYVVMSFRHYARIGLHRDQIWMMLKENLGHASVTTTIEIYGRAIADDEIALREAQMATVSSILNRL